MFDDDFGKELDEHFKRTSRLAGAGFVVSLVLAIAAFCGIAFVVYKVLAFFGIL